MKTSQLFTLLIVFITACNSYDHEAYVEEFKTKLDYDLNHYNLNKYDSIRLLSKPEEMKSLVEDRIANDCFYAENYSWYQLGKNLMLDTYEAKELAIESGFERPFFFLKFLESDTISSPVKRSIMKSLKERLYEKHNRDSVMISGSTAKDLFSAVHKYERSKYFFFINVDFEKAKMASDKQKKVVAQMMSCALNRLLEKIESKDKRYHLTITSGEEIGISESLFTIGKNIFEKGNEQLDELSKTDPEFVEKVDLNSGNGRFIIKKWDDAWTMYQLYGK